jgi:hypothetical protein
MWHIRAFPFNRQKIQWGGVQEVHMPTGLVVQAKDDQERQSKHEQSDAE